MPKYTSHSLQSLTKRLIDFRDERDWRQFQTLKNLIVSLNLEATEMLELTQWKNDEETEIALADEKFIEKLEEETADVLLYLLMISERAGIDLIGAASRKIDLNGEKYPVEKAHGNSRKYNEL